MMTGIRDNDIRPSLIRTEADEATYNLHVLLRFELEEAMLKGDLAAGDLPGAWTRKDAEVSRPHGRPMTPAAPAGHPLVGRRDRLFPDYTSGISTPPNSSSNQKRRRRSRRAIRQGRFWSPCSHGCARTSTVMENGIYRETS